MAETTITEVIGSEDTWVFFEGVGGISSDVPFPYEISIDGRPFAIDLAHYRWTILDMLRQAIDFSSRPGEQSFDTGGVWKRLFGDWSLGANQTYADTDRSSTRRFTESLGIDPWTERQLSLHLDTEVAVASDNTVLRALTVDSFIYLMEGTDHTLKRTTNLQAASPTLTTITGGPAAAFNDMTSDGNKVYIATASGLRVHDSAGTTMVAMGAPAATTVADIIAYANGWLLIARNNVLSSVTAAGAITAVKTHDNDDFVWTAITGAPNAIYAAGNAGDKSQIFRIEFNPTTGALAVPLFSGKAPDGETILAMREYVGNLLIGTSKGLRIGFLNGNGEVQVGPLIEASAVQAMDAEAEFVWFGWSNYDGSHTGLGRAKLSEFVAEFLPAYASDLMYVAQGNVVSVARFNDHVYFAVSGAGWIRASHTNELVETGTLRAGRAEFGTIEPKAFIAAEVLLDPLEGTLAVAVEDDAGESTAVGLLTKQGTTGSGTLMAGVDGLSTYWDTVLTFTRSEDDATAGPVLRQMVLRALPLPAQIEQWVLPIICTSHIAVGPGRDREFPQDARAVRDFFIALRRSGRTVIYREGTRQSLVNVRQVEIPEGGAQRWTADRDGLQGTLLVSISSVRA